MFQAKKIRLFNKPQADIYEVNVDLPEDTWIVSASILKTPGEYLLCTLNAIINKTKTNMVKQSFLVINHTINVDIPTLENLLFINSVDVDNETYSIFEIFTD